MASTTNFYSWNNFKEWGSAEKFISWPRYSHGMWPNEVYFWRVFLMDQILLPSMLQCLKAIGQNSHQHQIWLQPTNFSAHSHILSFFYFYYISVNPVNSFFWCFICTEKRELFCCISNIKNEFNCLNKSWNGHYIEYKIYKVPLA